MPAITTPSGLTIEELVVGSGAAAASGQKVSVHYTGWLTNGTKFDSSKDRGDPFIFPLGKGHVIKGWDEGEQGMKVGGKRKLTIPSKLAYGDAGHPPKIPPKATLVFEVELVSIGDDADAGAGDGGTKDGGSKDGGAKKDGEKKDGGAKKEGEKKDAGKK